LRKRGNFKKGFGGEKTKMSKDLEKFTSTSLRGQKRGIYEHSQGSLIMKGIHTEDKLTKIFTICEGALLSENKDKLDLEKVGVCSDVCVSLQNTIPSRIEKTEYVKVAWVFPVSDENYIKYVKPWHRVSLRFYPLLTTYRQSKYPQSRKLVHVNPFNQLEYHNEVVEYQEKLIWKIETELREYSEGFRFFTKTTALDLNSFTVLKGELAAWALKELSDIRRGLTKEISPKTWHDLRGQEDREEEEDLEDQLG
jgi:hypothetical protein